LECDWSVRGALALATHPATPLGTTMHESRVTVKIPRPLYRKIQLVIENAGFSSPTDFIVFVLRDLLGEAERKANGAESRPAPHPEHHEEFSAHDLENVKQKLRNLGYL